MQSRRRTAFGETRVTRPKRISPVHWESATGFSWCVKFGGGRCLPHVRQKREVPPVSKQFIELQVGANHAFAIAGVGDDVAPRTDNEAAPIVGQCGVGAA